MQRTVLVRALASAFAGACVLGASTAAFAAPPAASEQEVQKLESKLDALTQTLLDMKAQIDQLKAQNAALAAQQKQQTVEQAQQVQTTTQLKTEVAAASTSAAQALAKPSPLENINLWGYGEIYYNRPVHRTDLTQADLARAVFGIGYQFDDKTRFNSEFEVEHAVSSASDVGEFEVEQFYIDRELTPQIGLNAGLFLIPVGLLNESHEPTNFYGVQRNFVETLIIPSTWREGGLSLHGTTDVGFRYNVGVTTGLDLSKWNFTPEVAPYRTALELEDNDVAPMQATHQELALANAQHLSTYASVTYAGVPALTLGATVFHGGVVRNLPNVPDNESVTLWESHVRYTPGKWDFSALYASGMFTNTAEANVQYPGTPNPIPARFYGYYAQAAYNAWQSGDAHASPFVRFERYNMGARYDGIAPGYSATPSGSAPSASVPNSFGYFAQPYDSVSTVGLNYYPTRNVVFKVDYQHFNVNHDFTRVDLGMGLAF